MVPKIFFLRNFYSVEDSEALASFEFGIKSHLASCRLGFHLPEPTYNGESPPLFYMREGRSQRDVEAVSALGLG